MDRNFNGDRRSRPYISLLVMIAVAYLLTGCAQEDANSKFSVNDYVRISGVVERTNVKVAPGPVSAFASYQDVLMVIAGSEPLVRDASDLIYKKDLAVWFNRKTNKVIKRKLEPFKSFSFFEDQLFLSKAGAISALNAAGKTQVWDSGLKDIDSFVVLDKTLLLLQEDDRLYRWAPYDNTLSLVYEGSETSELKSLKQDPLSSSTAWFIDNYKLPGKESSGQCTFCKLDLSFNPSKVTTYTVESAGIVNSLVPTTDSVVLVGSAVTYKYNRTSMKLVSTVGNYNTWYDIDRTGSFAVGRDGVYSLNSDRKLIDFDYNTKEYQFWMSDACFISEDLLAIGYPSGWVSIINTPKE